MSTSAEVSNLKAHQIVNTIIALNWSSFSLEQIDLKVTNCHMKAMRAQSGEM